MSRTSKNHRPHRSVPCGRFIASPSEDRTIRIWDANNGKCLSVLKTGKGRVSCVFWSPDGEMIASGVSGRPVLLWEVRGLANASDFHSMTKKPHSELSGSPHNVHTMSWGSDGTRIAIGDAHGSKQLQMWRVNDGELDWQSETGHSQLNSIAWSPDGGKILSGGAGVSIYVWNATTGEKLQSSRSSHHPVIAVAWSPDGQRFAAADNVSVVQIWDSHSFRKLNELEGHTRGIPGVTFSADGELLATKSWDDSIVLWRTGDWQRLMSLKEAGAGSYWHWGIAFSPIGPRLASVDAHNHALRIWDFFIDDFVRHTTADRTLRYSSAKIVLVGESNVGKSCLAMRLAEDRYPEDHEHGTTHGMRFWPMEAEELHPAVTPPEGQRRDVVLWDFGGQDEYRLVHQLFLHDTTLALVLIDPTRGRAAMNEALDWNKQLEKQLGEGKAVKLLVGAQVDDDTKSQLINRAAIKELCDECKFDAFVETSALKNRGIDDLREALAGALDWDNLAKTSRPELFQQIRDDIERRRRNGEVVTMLTAFEGELYKAGISDQEDAYVAICAVTEQMATQGIIVRTTLSGGDEALVLQLPVIERYGGSLIVAARDNPRGVPTLEERLLGSASLPLPGMKQEDRVERFQEKIVLECIAELMIQHGICFRHEGLLVFPTLFPTMAGDGSERIEHSVSLFYDFTGAIDNIYASLVTHLMISEEFGKGRLWPGRVEFDKPGQGLCGIRQIKRAGGLAHIDLFYAEETP